VSQNKEIRGVVKIRAGQGQFDSAAAFGDNAAGFDTGWDPKGR